MVVKLFKFQIQPALAKSESRVKLLVVVMRRLSLNTR